MIRVAGAALIGALASAIWLALFYASAGGLRVDFNVDVPRLVTGIYRSEYDPASGLTFAWTGPEAGLRFPGLDRRAPWTLAVRLRAAGPPGTAHPAVTFYIDGVEVHTHQSTTAFEDVRMEIPPRPERRGLAVAMRSSSTFVPGRNDPRELGVQLDWVELRAGELVLPPAGMFAAAMCSGAALAAGVALLGVTAGSAIGGAVLLSAGQGAVLAHGFAPYTSLPDIAVRLAWGAAAFLALTSLVVRWRGRPLRNTARFAAAFSAGACFLELLVLLHPNMPIGDALFHAHRFQAVLAGNLYFTSVAPGGYAFPYAPGLYVAALPFAGLVQREFGDAALLRIVTTVADAGAGLLLYLMIARAWHDRLAGAAAVAIYHLMPLGFRIVTVGNLTNAFAESLTVVALALVTSPALRSPATVATAALVAVLTAAFLSHTSSFAILAVSAVCCALLFGWRGGPALRLPAWAIAAATSLAVLLAVVLYYAHFVETYRTELARLGAETASAAPDAGGRGVLERLAGIPRALYLYFGVPALILAAAGAVDGWRRGSRDRLALAVAAWLVACFLFLVVAVVTPLDMRYYLAVIPALALLAGRGASSMWRQGGGVRLAAVALLAWLVWLGVDTWWTTLA